MKLKITTDSKYNFDTVEVEYTENLKVCYCTGYTTLEKTTVHHNEIFGNTIVMIHTCKSLGAVLNAVVNKTTAKTGYTKSEFNHI